MPNITPQSAPLKLLTSLLSAFVLVLSAALVSACNESSFSGQVSKRYQPGQGGDGSVTGGGSTGGSSGGSTGGSTGTTDPDNPPGSTSGGRDNDGSIYEMPSVPLRVIYQAGDTIDTISYSGSFIFKVTRDGSSDTPTEIINTMSFGTSDSKRGDSRSVANLCYCGAINRFKLTITARTEQDVSAWKSAGSAMLTRSESSISGPETDNIKDWIKHQLGDNFNYGQHTILFGGFDHDWLSNQDVWSDDGDWGNNDDFKAIFTCQVEQCPNSTGTGTILDFVGVNL